MTIVVLCSLGDWFGSLGCTPWKTTLSTCHNSGLVPGCHDRSHSAWLSFLLYGLSTLVNRNRAQPSEVWTASFCLAVCWSFSCAVYFCLYLRGSMYVYLLAKLLVSYHFTTLMFRILARRCYMSKSTTSNICANGCLAGKWLISLEHILPSHTGNITGGNKTNHDWNSVDNKYSHFFKSCAYRDRKTIHGSQLTLLYMKTAFAKK